MNLIEELKNLVSTLDSEGIEYALCGGLAMAVYAKPRATLDIDLLIEPASLNRVIAAVEHLYFLMNARNMDFKGGKVKIYRLCKVFRDSNEVLVLNLFLVTPETKQAWESKMRVKWEGGVLTIVSPKGLIILKELRGSGQDRDDIMYLRGILDED